MDGIRKGDLLLLSPNALWLVTQLLTAIEQGSPWPGSTNCARTTFISKSEDDLSEAEQALYRRLRELAEERHHG